MGCILAIGAWGWALLLTLAAFGNSKEGALVFLITILVGWTPVGIMFWIGSKKRVKALRLKPEVASQSGIQIDSKFFHWEGDSGLALNESRQTITVAVGPNVKTYKFNEIRNWEIRAERFVPIGGGIENIGRGRAADAATGLFLTFKDIELPTWRIAMGSEKMRAVWLEILTQAINEGGTGQV